MGTVERLAKEYNVQIEIFDEESPEKFAKFAVSSIPTIFMMKDEEILQRLTGAQDEGSLVRLVNKLN